jgi:AAA domain
VSDPAVGRPEIERPANIRPPVERCPECKINLPKNGISGLCRACLGETFPNDAPYQPKITEAPAPEDPMDGLVNSADLEPERIDWLWQDYLPFDTVIVVDGDSTVGKSLTVIDLIARMSRDDPMPDGSFPADAAVIVLNKEDHWTKVTLPRLIAASADLAAGRIFFLEGKKRVVCGTCRKLDCRNPRHDKPQERWTSVVLPADIDWLAAKVRAVKEVTGCERVLIYADPLMAVIEDDVNTHNYHEMIRALEPIHRLCGDTGSAFLGIRHLTKTNTSGKALHAGQASVAVFSTSRMGLMVAYDPDDDNADENARARVLAVVGTNLGPKKKSLRWELEVVEITTKQGPTTQPRVRWLGESDVTANDIALLASGDRGPGALVQTKLLGHLKDGPVRHGDLWSYLEAETNASERTRWRVLGILIDEGKILKAKDHDRLTWYALPKHSTELEVTCGTR